MGGTCTPPWALSLLSHNRSCWRPNPRVWEEFPSDVVPRCPGVAPPPTCLTSSRLCRPSLAHGECPFLISSCPGGSRLSICGSNFSYSLSASFFSVSLLSLLMDTSLGSGPPLLSWCGWCFTHSTLQILFPRWQSMTYMPIESGWQPT